MAHAPGRSSRAFVSSSLLVLLLVALHWHSAATAASKAGRRPKLQPLPDTIEAPKENPTTPEKVELGKQLFFDPRLSGDNAMSCASCHLPAKAFTDGEPRAIGAGGQSLARNTPTLLNVALLDRYFWDGRAGSLEEQALAPIVSPDEMAQDLDELERELNSVPGYVEQFRRVFGTEVTRDGIAKALAAFQRTLVSRNSPLDRHLAGDKEALSPEARRGLELFTGEAGCVRCHHGPLLSDSDFYRLGVSFEDEGRAAVSGRSEDRYRFRTPSLREIARTAPYMHDGSQKTLYEVVEFYLRRAPGRSPDGLEIDVEPVLGLSYADIDALVAFLQSLSGELPRVEPPELPK